MESRLVTVSFWAMVQTITSQVFILQLDRDINIYTHTVYLEGNLKYLPRISIGCMELVVTDLQYTHILN